MSQFAKYLLFAMLLWALPINAQDGTLLYRGTVTSNRTHHPLPEIYVEMEPVGGGDVVKATPTDAAGGFEVRIQEQTAYKLKFYRELSTGHVLVGSGKIDAVDADVREPHEFTLPISSTGGHGEPLEFKGSINDERNQPFEGTLYVVSDATGHTIGTLQAISGQFRAVILIAPETTFRIDAADGFGHRTEGVYALTSHNLGDERHEINMGEEEEEAPAVEEPTPLPNASNGVEISFVPGTADITPASKKRLATMAAQLVERSDDVIAIRGLSRKYNMAHYDRTQRRVLAIVYFLRKEGVVDQQMNYSYTVPASLEESDKAFLLLVR